MQGRNKLIKILSDANKNQKDSFTLVRWLPGEAASWVWSGNDTHDCKSFLSTSQCGLVQKYRTVTLRISITCIEEQERKESACAILVEALTVELLLRT